MRSPSSDPPVLILGSGLTSLGVLRGLAKIGITTYCASRQAKLIRRSRWYHPVPGRREFAAHPRDLEQYLERLVFPRAVLIPCDDEWALAIAGRSEGSQARFPASLPSAATLASLMDKGLLRRALGELKLPHPRSVAIADEHDLQDVPADLLAHAFLKPRSSQAFFRQYGVKAFRVASLDEAVGRYRDLRAKGLEVLLQEYIPGPATNHYFIDGFVDRTGRVCAIFARRRIRMYPPDFGNSSYLTSIPRERVADAVNTLIRLISAVGYRGIFSVEFKLDERDGQYKMLDFNVRPWWYIEYADQCGVPVAVMAYQDALEREVEPVNSYKIGVNLVHPAYDRYVCWELYRRGELTLASWAKSWLNASPAIFTWRDPLPSVLGMAEWLGDAVANRLPRPLRRN